MPWQAIVCERFRNLWLCAIACVLGATDRQLLGIGAAPPFKHLRLRAYEGNSGALQWITKDKEFFGKLGLNVDINGFVSTRVATDALILGQGDATSRSKFILVSLGLLAGPRLCICIVGKVCPACDDFIASPTDTDKETDHGRESLHRGNA